MKESSITPGGPPDWGETDGELGADDSTPSNPRSITPTNGQGGEDTSVLQLSDYDDDYESSSGASDSDAGQSEEKSHDFYHTMDDHENADQAPRRKRKRPSRKARAKKRATQTQRSEVAGRAQGSDSRVQTQVPSEPTSHRSPTAVTSPRVQVVQRTVPAATRQRYAADTASATSSATNGVIVIDDDDMTAASAHTRRVVGRQGNQGRAGSRGRSSSRGRSGSSSRRQSQGTGHTLEVMTDQVARNRASMSPAQAQEDRRHYVVAREVQPAEGRVTVTAEFGNARYVRRAADAPADGSIVNYQEIINGQTFRARIARGAGGVIGRVVGKQACHNFHRHNACSRPDCDFLHARPNQLVSLETVVKRSCRGDQTLVVDEMVPEIYTAWYNSQSSTVRDQLGGVYDPIAAALQQQVSEAERRNQQRQDLRNRLQQLGVTEERALGAGAAEHVAGAAAVASRGTFDIDANESTFAFNFPPGPKPLGDYQASWNEINGTLGCSEADYSAQHEGMDRQLRLIYTAVMAKTLETREAYAEKHARRVKAMYCAAPSTHLQDDGVVFCGRRLAEVGRQLSLHKLPNGPYVEADPHGYLCIHCLTHVFCSRECAAAAGHPAKCHQCRPHPVWR